MPSMVKLPLAVVVAAGLMSGLAAVPSPPDPTA
jgi:hypothetical protein